MLAKYNSWAQFDPLPGFVKKKKKKFYCHRATSFFYMFSMAAFKLQQQN